MSVRWYPRTHPFEFPMPNWDEAIVMAPPLAAVVVENGIDQTLISMPTGTSGVIRNISLVVGGPPSVGLSDLTFNIKYDGESSPSVSVPLRCLFGIEFPLLTPNNLRVNTPCFAITDSENPGATGVWALNFRLPIPFTNGITIYLSVPGGSANSYAIWSNIIYQNRLRAWWNSKLRLFATRSNEAVAATTTINQQLRLTTPTNLQSQTNFFAASDVGKSLVGDMGGMPTDDLLILAFIDQKNVTVDARDTVGAGLNIDGPYTRKLPTHVFLNLPAGEAGWIAMITGGVTNTTSVSAMYEGNPRFHLNGNLTADLEWSAVEDFANGAFLFDQKPYNQSEDGGLTAEDATHFSIYKSFYNFPICYNNGIVGRVTRPIGPGNSTYNWTTVYYKVMN